MADFNPFPSTNLAPSTLTLLEYRTGSTKRVYGIISGPSSVGIDSWIRFNVCGIFSFAVFGIFAFIRLKYLV